MSHCMGKVCTTKFMYIKSQDEASSQGWGSSSIEISKTK